MADSSSRPLQALHTPTLLAHSIVYEVLRPLYGVPSSPRALQKHLIVPSKVRGLQTPGSKNLCGAAPPMLSMLLTL